MILDKFYTTYNVFIAFAVSAFATKRRSATKYGVQSTFTWAVRCVRPIPAMNRDSFSRYKREKKTKIIAMCGPTKRKHWWPPRAVRFRIHHNAKLSLSFTKAVFRKHNTRSYFVYPCWMAIWAAASLRLPIIHMKISSTLSSGLTRPKRVLNCFGDMIAENTLATSPTKKAFDFVRVCYLCVSVFVLRKRFQ